MFSKCHWRKLAYSHLKFRFLTAFPALTVCFPPHGVRANIASRSTQRRSCIHSVFHGVVCVLYCIHSAFGTVWCACIYRQSHSPQRRGPHSLSFCNFVPFLFCMGVLALASLIAPKPRDHTRDFPPRCAFTTSMLCAYLYLPVAQHKLRGHLR
jgi:hypothetical protein